MKIRKVELRILSPELRNFRLVNVFPLLEIAGDWIDFLSEDISEQETKDMRQHERNGRPLGSEHFVQTVEKGMGRMLRLQKPGPKKKHGS